MSDTEQDVKQDTAKTNRYVVVADAVVVTIGTKADGKASFTRVPRGGVINGTEDAAQIALLLESGAIKRVKNRQELAEIQADLLDPRTSRHRQTARQAAAASAPKDDPIEAIVEGIQPAPAPFGETDPDAILASSLAGAATA